MLVAFVATVLSFSYHEMGEPDYGRGPETGKVLAHSLPTMSRYREEPQPYPEPLDPNANYKNMEGRVRVKSMVPTELPPKEIPSLTPAYWNKILAVNATCGADFDLTISDEREWYDFSNPVGKGERAKPLIVMPAEDDWREVCAAVTETVTKVEKARNGTGDTEMQFLQQSKRSFSLAITTFRGAATLDNAVNSYRASGLFDHPDFDEIIFHVNKCRCEDLYQIKNLVGGGNASLPAIPYKVICVVTNSLHPVVLVRLISHSRSIMTIMTENDRPIVQRPNETKSAYHLRVKNFIDLGISLASGSAYISDEVMVDSYAEEQAVDIDRPGANPSSYASGWDSRDISYITMQNKHVFSKGKRTYFKYNTKSSASVAYPETPTPYVLLERQAQISDDHLFFKIAAELRNYTDDQKLEAFGSRGTHRPIDTLMWDVAEHNRTDWNEKSCWHVCYRFVSGNGYQRYHMSKKCNRLMKLSGQRQKWNDCEWRTCREWVGWRKGAGDGPSSCLHPWLRNLPLTDQMHGRFISSLGDRHNGGPIACFRLKGWTNGPALFNTHWYRRDIGGMLCGVDGKSGASAKQSGLVYRRNKPYFGWYGRQMEYNVQRSIRLSDGVPHCRGDGLMDEVEIESFDGETPG